MLRLFYRHQTSGNIIRHFTTTLEIQHQNLNATVSNDDEEYTKLNNYDENDDFYKNEFKKNHIQLSGVQKIFLAAGSSIAAILDPSRHEMIACLGETTGEAALQNILKLMQESSEGIEILNEKPRINSKTIDLESLKYLPEDSFGFLYYKFLKDNNVTPDSRLRVRFLDNPQLAYIMTRYRECHDMAHTVLGMPTNMLGEVAVKWIEALNIGLPMCYGGAVFGAVRLRPKQRKQYMQIYLPWALENGKKMKPLMNVYWEKRFEQNIEDLRKELKITTVNQEYKFKRSS